jgi:hypothetical protein
MFVLLDPKPFLHARTYRNVVFDVAVPLVIVSDGAKVVTRFHVTRSLLVKT